MSMERRIVATISAAWAGLPQAREDTAIALIVALRPDDDALNRAEALLAAGSRTTLDEIATWPMSDDESKVFWMENGLEEEDGLAAKTAVLDRARSVLARIREHHLDSMVSAIEQL